MIYTKCNCGCTEFYVSNHDDIVCCSKCGLVFNWQTGEGLEFDIPEENDLEVKNDNH